MGGVGGDWASLPGETPIDDISGLKVSGVASRADLNRCEAENIRRAVVKYLAAKPSRRSARFDLRWLLQLHEEMFGDVWAWAGRLRATQTNIGEPPQHIEAALQNLLEDLAYWSEHGESLLDQAVRLHHRAVRIHPFNNGNGRWARLLANIWLKLSGHPATEWPEETIGAVSTIRDEYIRAIKAADAGDDGPLRGLHRRYTADP